MTKHLSLNDRILIKKYLDDDLTFAFISRRLGRSLSTVSREVRNHRAYTGDYDRLSPNGCSGYRSCLKRNLCSTENYYTCQNRCKFCQEYDCKTLCDKFDPAFCAALEAPPYVCNGCPKEKECKKIHAYYSAGSADRKYRETLSSSRQGIHTPMEDLERIDAIVAPLIRKGQSINHIFASHREEIGLCEKTLYNYIDLNVFSFRNIDLPKKVRYRIRHPQKVATKLEYEYRKGRTIDCFRAYVEENPSLDIVEMDTVKGARRTHVFYCDSQASWQKPHVEKNHTLIRRILPKGTSFSFLTDGDVSLITRHINSVPRESFDNRTPFDLMTSPEQKKLLEFLKLSPIPLDDVLLKPALLKRKK